VRKDHNLIYAGPNELPSHRAEYDFEMPQPEDVYTRIASHHIAAGLKSPNSSEFAVEILPLVPKRLVPPLLPKTMGTEGWDLHAIQGWSFLKITSWFIMTHFIGFIFVFFWLGFVNKMDLQNAFIPLTFFTASVMVSFGICQFFTPG
jgi:hypothetical protein